MTAPDVEPLMTIDDLSAYLKVPVNTIYGWRKRGKGPTALKPAGGPLRWRVRDVDSWLDAQVAQDRPAPVTMIPLQPPSLPRRRRAPRRMKG